MEKIKLTFLGTASSIPTKKRNHTAMLVSYKSENILIDCGEGTQRQFKLADISPSKITRILITHWHGDHTLGLPGLLETLAMSDYSKSLYLYGPKGTSENLSLLNRLMKFYKKFQKYNLSVKEIFSGKVFETPDFTITAEQMSHGAPALAYSFQIKDKLRLNKEKLKKLKITSSKDLKALSQGSSIKHNGKTVSASSVSYIEKGRKITFILDTLPNKNAIKLSKNSDLLICESSFSESESQIASKYKHLTTKQAAQIAKLSKSKALILTHISQRYDSSISEIEKQAKSVFPNTKIANDLDVIELWATKLI